MPTLRKDRDNAWMGRVIIAGRQVASRIFPPGRRNGPEWAEAKVWEEKTRQEINSLLERGASLQAALRSLGLSGSPPSVQPSPTPLGLERLLAWAESYLDFAERTMTRSTRVEKGTIMQQFFSFCHARGIDSPEAVNSSVFYDFLCSVADVRGPNRANVYRKNLLSAWSWGVIHVAGFPQAPNPLAKIQPFPVEEHDRYVPPEEDVIKVLQMAHGQDLVMLLTYYFTGGRKSELFRLRWSTDVRLTEGKIRLTDRKGKKGKVRVRWYDMHAELIKAYAWWRQARPCEVDNVFMQLHCKSALGLPFKQRRHLMKKLCERAGVKPFGFHGLRHKAAAITFKDGGINAAQVLMGHDRATTTDRYVKSAGLYTNQGDIIDALARNGIGQEGLRLLKMEMPREVIREACNQKHVTKYASIN